MIEHLKYSVTFPTGRTLGADINFTTGLTGVVGENESGKSMILEMVRYSLFGTKALRGAAADYKNLKVSLTFGVKGGRYRVERTKSNGSLEQDVDGTFVPVASGTKAVNNRIIQLFGYGLRVFDAANNCAQGEVEALSAMLPAQRKKMVDEVIGLDTLDNLAEWLNQEENTLLREAEALLQANPAPTKPEQAEDQFYPSEYWTDKITNLQAMKSELDQLRGFLSQRLVKPVLPTCTVDTPLDKLVLLQTAHTEAVNRKHQLEQAISQIPEAKHSPEELQQASQGIEFHREWKAYQDDIARRGARPTLTNVSEVTDHAKVCDELDHWMHLSRLEEMGEHTCPECEHSWPVADELHGVTVPEEAPEPQYTRLQLSKEQVALELWADFAPNPELDIPEPGLPPFTEKEIREGFDALNRSSERLKLQTELNELEVPESLATEIEARRTYEAQMNVYNTSLLDFETRQDDYHKAEKRVSELKHVDEELVSARQGLECSRNHEAAWKVYRDASAVYTEKMAEIVERQERADGYKRAVKALRKLRLRVKEYLVPSLSRVASKLLASMTGGKRVDIDIDEEFNILVDGQSLNTLSGSGKAAANLAIRIGLGQVLTNKVFSVFMADEIDASMDEDRAGFTAECLRSLTKHIGQIVQVSHKHVDADTYIEL